MEFKKLKILMLH